MRYIAHYGVGHDKGGHSGRYPWGSGSRPFQRGLRTGASQNMPPMKTRKYSEIEDIIAVNPGFKKYNDPKWKNNCTYCSATYELRRRGYDVTANPLGGSGGVSGSELVKFFKGSKMKIYGYYSNKDPVLYKKLLIKNSAKGKNKNLSKRVIKDILKDGPNTSGCISMFWNSGIGHTMNYKVTNKKIELIDTQSHITYDQKSSEQLLRYMVGVDYIRWDNLEVNENKMKEFCTWKKH